MDMIAQADAPVMATNRPLAGKGALVTGSTSGIGLGIARGLAAAGANLLLNGFGDAGAIARLRDGLEREFAVTVGYSAADMSRPGQIEVMLKEADRAVAAFQHLVGHRFLRFPPPHPSPTRGEGVSAALGGGVLPEIR